MPPGRIFQGFWRGSRGNRFSGGGGGGPPLLSLALTGRETCRAGLDVLGVTERLKRGSAAELLDCRRPGVVTGERELEVAAEAANQLFEVVRTREDVGARIGRLDRQRLRGPRHELQHAARTRRGESVRIHPRFLPRDRCEQRERQLRLVGRPTESADVCRRDPANRGDGSKELRSGRLRGW